MHCPRRQSYAWKVIFVAVTCIVIYVVYINRTHLSAVLYRTFLLKNNYNPSTFHPVYAGGVYSYFNVCIETIDQPVEGIVGDFNQYVEYNETQRIVVYNYRGTETGKHRIEVAGPHITLNVWNHWDIFFTNRSIPDTHTFRKNTAFFVVPTCPVNLHHFWEDEFVRLYSVIKLSNKLHPGESNQILYRQPYHLLNHVGHICWNYLRFEDILRTLSTESFHGVFYSMKPNTCFSSAVFGTDVLQEKSRRESVEHVFRELGVNQNQLLQGNFTTFVRRSNRRVLNIKELADAARMAGIPNVRIVSFEKLSIKSQAEIAASSRIMIGVRGAGLQWSIFMPRGSTLVEIEWPKKQWPAYYPGFLRLYGIRHIKLAVEPEFVYANWTTYERYVRYGKVTNETDRKYILEHPYTNVFDRLWKHADVVVDKTVLIQKLLTVEY